MKKISIQNITAAVILTGIAAAGLYFLQLYYPLGVDWEYSFAPLPEMWRDPFVIPTFTNPPWIIGLLPHTWLPTSWGNAVNLMLNILVITLVIKKFEGGWQTMFMVFTSPPFLDLARTNNVTWIPLLALLVPPQWGLPILAIKPHSLGAVALVWWKKQNFNWKMFVPLGVVALVSFAIWGFWPLKFGLIESSDWWNFSVWPLGLPLGIYMLYKAYKSEDEFLAAAATPFLTPYIAPYSITALFAYVGSKYKKEMFFVYVAFWAYVIIESRRLALMG